MRRRTRAGAPLRCLVGAAVAATLLVGCGSGEDDAARAGAEPPTTGAPGSSPSGPGSAAPGPGAGTSTPEGGAGAGGEGGGAGSEPGQAGAGTSPRTSDRPRGLPTLRPGRDQTEVLRRLPGGGSDACQDVGPHRDVRSGGFSAGPFDEARAGYRPAYGDARTLRLTLVPQHADRMPGVAVTATPSGGGRPVRVRQDEWADAEQFRFYDVQLPVPRAGTWRITAAAGPDRGCWILDLG